MSTTTLRRGKTKQPEYDPSELDDLIQSPAVGSGVGSHLLDKEGLTPGGVSPLGPGVISDMASGGVSSSSPDVASLIAPGVTPADTSVSAAIALPSQLWVTESGEVVMPNRVRPLETAWQALSPGETSIYRLLLESAGVGDEGGESGTVQLGYADLIRSTQLSRKTVQRTIDKLIEKGYASIETQPDIYERTPTVYRVFSPTSVYRRLREAGKCHVARVGPGIAFVSAANVMARL